MTANGGTIFTFYSYKGGVGRSMAMAGIAYLLAKRGLRVLAIDFDLEAPGLERYFFDAERSRTIRAQKGLLDLIEAYRAALSSESAFEQAEFKRWERYKLTAISIAGQQGGSVDLMTAGQREPESSMREYALAVRSFDWQDFFHNWKGDLFFDWLRRQLTQPGSGYDVVLVDSRTGVTEMGGVCAYQLADAAVLFCALNYQNLEGTRDVARDFRSDGVLGLRQGRPLEILAVPSRVEENHPKRAEFMESFKREMGVEGLPKVLADAGLTYANLALPYVPQFAVAERLVGDTQGDLAGAAAPIEVFERLADALTLLAQPESALGQLRGESLARLTGKATEEASGLLADVTLSSAGYDAFVDHSPADGGVVHDLLQHLERAGFRAIAASARKEGDDHLNWAYDQALEYSQSLLVCFGQPTHTETRARLIARARRLQTVRILPVLLPGSDPAVMASFDLNLSQAVDLRGWPDEAAMQTLMSIVSSGVRSAHAAPALSESMDREPYPGARAYTEDDAAFFFGRGRATALLCQALTDHDVVAINGAAQVGKTSLVRAGLLPQIRPGPSASSGFGFSEMASLDYAAGNDAVEWPHWLRSDSEPTSDDTELSPKRQLVVIDSIDSFDAGADIAHRRQRYADIERALKHAGPDCKFVLIMRNTLPQSERRAALEALDKLRCVHFELSALEGDSLRMAIEEPAKRAGHLLEPGLTDRLIESAGAARNAIAQIQRAIAAIWPERRRGWLTNKNLDAVGHLGGVMQRHRLAVLDMLSDEHRTAAKLLFSRLITLSSNYELVASPQRWDSLATIPAIAAIDAVALRDRLASAGLIDLWREGGQESNPGSRWEIHVALARPDPTVYFQEGGSHVDLKLLMWRDTVAGQAARWRAGSAEAVLRGSALAEAMDWRERVANQLTQVESEYIEASSAAAARQAALTKERENAEREASERYERMRREAAEALAAEQGVRLQIEAEARKNAQADAARLRRGRFILVSLLVVALTLSAMTIWQGYRERTLRTTAEESAAQALAEAQRARAGEQSADEAAKRASQAIVASSIALDSAQQAKQLAESVLTTHSDETRRRASEQLRVVDDKIRSVWADIQGVQTACPVGRRIFLHIGQEQDRAAARSLIPLLEKSGFIVPGIELVKKDKVPQVTDVRYFRDTEAAAAAAAARALRDSGVRDAQIKLMPGFENSPSVRPCHYEIWFANQALAKR